MQGHKRLLSTVICQEIGQPREEMDTFLESYHQQSRNHEEIENLNGLIPSKEIESAIKNLK